MEEIKIIRLQWTTADDDKIRKFIAETSDINDLTTLIEQIPYRTQCAIKQRVLKIKYDTKKVYVQKNTVKSEVKQTVKTKLDDLYKQLASTKLLDPNYSELLNQINNLEITIDNQKRWKSHST